MRRLAWLAILAAVLLGCGGAGASSTPTEAAVSTPEATLVCTGAPEWLRAAIQDSIRPKGAELGAHKTFIAPASNLDGPPIVTSDKFAKAWFVGARINGGGVDNEPATWLTNSLKEGEGMIFAVNAAARRYSELGADVEIDITGDGEFDVRRCLGQYQSSLTDDLGNVFTTAGPISDSL